MLQAVKRIRYGHASICWSWMQSCRDGGRDPKRPDGGVNGLMARSKAWPHHDRNTAPVAKMLKGFGMRVVGVSSTPRKVEGFEAMVPTDRLTEADHLIRNARGIPGIRTAFSDRGHAV
jgi:hypothetical protein